MLAWLGGVAVLAGLAFLLTIAVSRGWIGEGARTALAGVALARRCSRVGVWLRERRGRNDAALAAAAAGIAGAFGTLVVAGPVYDLVPVAVALAGALAVGALATALAVRWRAQVIGWLGLLGALLAPAVLGACGGASPFLAVAFAATVAVLVWQRWTRLGVVAFAARRRCSGCRWLDADGPRSRPRSRCSSSSARSPSSPPSASSCAGASRAVRIVRRPRCSVLNALALDAAGWLALHGRRCTAATALARRRRRRAPRRRAWPARASRACPASSR